MTPQADDASSAATTRLHWTVQAAAYCVGGALLVIAGALTQRPLLLLLGGTLLAAVFLDSLGVWAKRPRLEVTTSPQRVPENAKTTIKMTGDGLGRRDDVRVSLSPALELEHGDSNIATPTRSGRIDHSMEATAPVRGPQRIGPVIVRHWSLLRLWVLDRRASPSTTVEVIPRTEDASEVRLTSRMLRPMQGRFTVNRPGHGMDFFSLRDYQQGDTIRSINWKATARADDLIVNQRQRETQSEVLILLDARLITGVGPLGRTPLDRACRVALGLFEDASKARDSVHFYVYGDKLTGLPRGRGSDRLMALQSLLARLPAAGTQSIADAWKELRTQVASDAVVLVITSGELEPQLGPVATEMSAYGHPVTIISPTPAGSWWESDPVRRNDRERILDVARNAGAMIVDWKEDQSLTADPPVLAKTVTP